MPINYEIEYTDLQRRIAILERKVEEHRTSVANYWKNKYDQVKQQLAEAQKLPEEIDEETYSVYGSGWNDCLRTIRQMRHEEKRNAWREYRSTKYTAEGGFAATIDKRGEK